MYLIPNIKKLKEDSIPWRIGFFRKRGEGILWEKRTCLDQSSIPSDFNLLKAIDIYPSDYVLFIAGGYGTWANALAVKGIKVDYSDISLELIDFVKNRFILNDYILADYIDIPFQEDIYDWTVSYEPMGSSQGLPIAMLRSLLNKKGGKLIISQCNPISSKPRKFSSIIQEISKIYKCDYQIEETFIYSFTHCGEPIKTNHIIYTIYTNPQARQMSKHDIKLIFKTSNNIQVFYNKNHQESLERITNFSQLIDNNWLHLFSI